MDIVDLIFEAKGKRYPSGRGSYTTKKKSGKATAAKSKVKVYDTLEKAVCAGHPGQMMSTKGSKRIYVISKQRKKQKSQVPSCSGRIAKGFTPGSATPSAKFSSIKAHSVRTMRKHGKRKSAKFDKYKEHS